MPTDLDSWSQLKDKGVAPHRPGPPRPPPGARGPTVVPLAPLAKPPPAPPLAPSAPPPLLQPHREGNSGNPLHGAIVGGSAVRQVRTVA
jgi:hypothetical protein